MGKTRNKSNTHSYVAKVNYAMSVGQLQGGNVPLGIRWKGCGSLQGSMGTTCTAALGGSATRFCDCGWTRGRCHRRWRGMGLVCRMVVMMRTGRAVNRNSCFIVIFRVYGKAPLQDWFLCSSHGICCLLEILVMRTGATLSLVRFVALFLLLVHHLLFLYLLLVDFLLLLD